ncbi:hypothetical protein BCR37DRAFT_203478 [Protomyces lactucae-debilis]|uniref:BTB domain-containing protein n=1 Tax=Protomyces lactucae-debilis TaxID=2754530 RepID=A0A1Y2FQ16_PROLT|nr:uncharacterized protein BCR37DRAFT_203478 [Protomyces lactucae-debilis]ORY86080.1 hypothetical protein BCR37DRAFT_203478 [Protomyces lactucae-debilis]
MTKAALSYNDLTISFKKCSGTIPPPLVGASVSALGSKIFVVAGRLVSNRQMTNDIYVLDKPSGRWERLPSGPQPPPARYFHSACAKGSRIYIFGGMGAKSGAEGALCVFNDLSWYDVRAQLWKTVEASPVQPPARYAHLAVITDEQLIVIGGQNLDNHYLRDLARFDLRRQEWLPPTQIDPEFGSYRSLAVALDTVDQDRPKMRPSCDTSELQDSERAGQVLLFSNYNFADVHRDLYNITSGNSGVPEITDLSNRLCGQTLPPGLRFPSGYRCGQRYLVVSGVYMLAHDQSLELWLLDLDDLSWIPIDTGTVGSKGSWNKGCFCDYDNTFMMLGNMDRSLAEDYNHRQSNFEHMVSFDLEAHGIYSPQRNDLPTAAIELGLSQLADGLNADLDIVTQERTIISVSCRVLSARWGLFQTLIQQADESSDPDSPHRRTRPGSLPMSTYTKRHPYGDRSRCLYMPYNHATVSAFIRFIYSETLPSSVDTSAHSTCSLLLMAVSVADHNSPTVENLIALCKARLHGMLDVHNASMIYETCTLTRHTGLQIRALRLMLASRNDIGQHNESASLA